MIKWTADDPIGVTALQSLVGVARSDGAYVLVGEVPREEGSTFAAWGSTDGRTWELTKEFPVNERILALSQGGPGFVVSGFDDHGATVWTSDEGGRTWRSVIDSSLANGVIAQLVPTASGVVGFGWRSTGDNGAIWTSPDGIDWLAATNETGLTVARGLQAVGAYDGRAIAFVSRGDTKGPAIWETTGRAEWTRIGTLDAVTTIDRVAGGPRGWVALDSNRAWTSSDGRAWGKGVAGPDVASDVIVDDAGYVAVGFVGSLPGDTCGDQRPFAGHTWTSSDGRVWKRMPVAKEFSSAMVTRLFVVDRTLVGFGQRFGESADVMPVARWTAALPAVARPADNSDKASVFESCGG